MKTEITVDDIFLFISQRFNPNILKKVDSKTGKNVQYCCVAIGSRDRSISIWFTSLKRPLVVVHDIFDDSVSVQPPFHDLISVGQAKGIEEVDIIYNLT